jgi:hypothetical protein
MVVSKTLVMIQILVLVLVSANVVSTTSLVVCFFTRLCCILYIFFFFVQGILEALEFKLAKGWKPQRTLYVAFGHDEEVSTQSFVAKYFGP